MRALLDGRARADRGARGRGAGGGGAGRGRDRRRSTTRSSCWRSGASRRGSASSSPRRGRWSRAIRLGRPGAPRWRRRCRESGQLDGARAELDQLAAPELPRHPPGRRLDHDGHAALRPLCRARRRARGRRSCTTCCCRTRDSTWSPGSRSSAWARRRGTSASSPATIGREGEAIDALRARARGERAAQGPRSARPHAAGLRRRAGRRRARVAADRRGRRDGGVAGPAVGGAAGPAAAGRMRPRLPTGVPATLWGTLRRALPSAAHEQDIGDRREAVRGARSLEGAAGPVQQGRGFPRGARPCDHVGRRAPRAARRARRVRRPLQEVADGGPADRPRALQARDSRRALEEADERDQAADRARRHRPRSSTRATPGARAS